MGKQNRSSVFRRGGLQIDLNLTAMAPTAILGLYNYVPFIYIRFQSVKCFVTLYPGATFWKLSSTSSLDGKQNFDFAYIMMLMVL